MTAPAVVRSADLKRMGDFVRKNPGLRVEVEKDGIILRVSPDIQDIHRPQAVDASLPTGSNALSEWRRLNESRFGGNPSRQKNPR